jgi:succinate-acetate transporter protein
MALGVGGLAQLLAGMWEFAAGNTFGATGTSLFTPDAHRLSMTNDHRLFPMLPNIAFSSYGGFWISFALIYWPGSG